VESISEKVADVVTVLGCACTEATFRDKRLITKAPTRTNKRLRIMNRRKRVKKEVEFKQKKCSPLYQQKQTTLEERFTPYGKSA
jgi:hypothetical protein